MWIKLSVYLSECVLFAFTKGLVTSFLPIATNSVTLIILNVRIYLNIIARGNVTNIQVYVVTLIRSIIRHVS